MAVGGDLESVVRNQVGANESESRQKGVAEGLHGCEWRGWGREGKAAS